MADKELGALSPIETLLAAALFHTVQQGNSRKVTAQQIADFVNGNYPAFIQTLLSAQDADDVYAAIGAAPDANKLGGQLPSFFASAEAVSLALQDLSDALAGKVPNSRTVAGKPLTGNITLAKADVGLGNADNTSDVNKPVSTAQQTALDLKVTGPDGGVVANDLLVSADNTGKVLKKAPSGVVTNALLSNVATATIKGRVDAGTGEVQDLTPAQARTVLGVVPSAARQIRLGAQAVATTVIDNWTIAPSGSLIQGVFSDGLYAVRNVSYRSVQQTDASGNWVTVAQV